MPLEEISLILQLYIVLACPLTQDTHQLRQPMTGNWHLMMFSQSRKPIQPQLLQDSISSNSGTTWSITNLEFMNRVDEATPNETTNGSSCYLPHLCVWGWNTINWTQSQCGEKEEVAVLIFIALSPCIMYLHLGVFAEFDQKGRHRVQVRHTQEQVLKEQHLITHTHTHFV